MATPEYNRLYEERNKEKMQAYRKAYYAKRYQEEKEVFLARNKKWSTANLEKHRELNRRNHRERQYTRLRKYGVSPEQYDAMKVSQQGVCELCNKSCVSGRDLAVDHCHETKKVRGLLCMKCNRGLGLFCDDPALMRLAADYIERHK